jgi:hypothetical protein
MSFESMLSETKQFQTELKDHITASKIINTKIKHKNKKGFVRIFRSYFKRIDGIVTYKTGLEYDKLENKKMYLQESYDKCLKTLKQYDCIIYKVTEDTRQIDYNGKSRERNNKTSVYNFICRCDKWFFECFLNFDNNYYDGWFEVEKFYNAETNEKLIFQCHLFKTFSFNKDVDYLFEALQSPNYTEYMQIRWKYLYELPKKLEARGYVANTKDNDFKIYPNGYVMYLTVDNNEMVLNYSKYDWSFVISTNGDTWSEYVIEIKYESEKDFDDFLDAINTYILFANNKYGLHHENIYYNDKQIIKLIDSVKDTCKTKYKELYKNGHGYLTKEKSKDSKNACGEYSAYTVTGIDMLNKIYCDFNIVIKFGQNCIKIAEDPENKTTVLNIDKKNQYYYETYKFKIKLYEVEDTIILKLITEQYKSHQTEPEVLKNTITNEGGYFEVFDKIKDQICQIYDAYNMPLDIS